MPRQSWFRYHGTGMHAAMVAVSMNTLNKSEMTRGMPAPGDTQNTKTGNEKMEGRYETAVGRGVYPTADFDKAHAYAIPFCQPGKTNIQVHIVLLLRVPGSLQMTGALIQFCQAKSKSLLYQQDEGGNEMHLEANWAVMELGGETLRKVLLS